MIVALYLSVFGTGLLAGSFLNLVSDRMRRKENFVSGRSYCEKCKKALQAKDLIPLVSYLINLGKCAYCKKKLSPIYPASELLAGLFYVLIFYFLQKSNLGWEYYFYYYFNFSILLIIFWYDFKYYEIPFNLILVGAVSSFIVRIFLLQNLNINNFLFEIASWLGIFLFYYLIILISKGGMGGGDLKLSVYLGILLGFPNSFYAIYYGFLIGGIFAFLLLILKKKSLKAKIPFGPFLILGALFCLFFNSQ